MGSGNYIHIVAFDMPYPPNYGGIIDIFYKIKALHDNGVKVILHVFLYDGKGPTAALSKLCSKIYYYDRRKFTNPFTGDIPYIVSTRNNEQLLENLLKDKHPILFEGLHTTYFLNHRKLQGRYKIVRTHNVEHLYYRALEEAETGFFKKYFFRVESERLEQYETILRHANQIATISPSETAYYAARFSQTQYIPAFHGNEEISCRPGRGKFVLYHGNLGVGENNKAALYLVHEVFAGMDIPVVIAGNNPSRQLRQAVKGNPYINLVNKISSDDILELISIAHINVMATFQSTGIKLKLLNSLYRGRYCVVNGDMVESTGLESLCHVGNSSAEMKELISDLWKKDFDEAEIQARERILQTLFNNSSNAEILMLGVHEAPVTV